MASSATDLFTGDDEEEFTPIHMADADEQLDTDIKVPSEVDMDPSEMDSAVADEPAEEAEDGFAATAIIQATDMPEPQAPAPAAVGAEQDDVLNEVDVYLAYGLYDNAEDLLVTSLAENSDRPDYRSKLLDTYFATKNVNAFVGEAEKLKGMGDSAASYWDRVQIMGYELAPDNALFSDAKDSGLSAADLEIAKPQEADFDLGSEDGDNTNFSSTEYNIGAETTGLDLSVSDEAGDLGETQQVSTDFELPLLDEDDAGEEIGDDLLDLPGDLDGELEFSMDDDDAGDELPLADDLELPDDLDLEPETAADEIDAIVDLDLDDDQEFTPASEETELEILDEDEDEDEDKAPAQEFSVDDEVSLDLDSDDDAIDFEIDDDVSVDDDDLGLDDAVELSPPDEDEPAFVKTSVITPNYEETAVIDRNISAEADAESEDPSEIDLGMEDTAVVEVAVVADTSDDDGDDIDLGMDDTAMRTADDLAEATGGLLLDMSDDEDSEDISIIDFGGEDFEEPTAVLLAIEDGDDDDFLIDDEEAEDTRTGTFAPGDFDAPTDAVASIADVDDIDDLMLPDDVDEVSTKLDLARAFIDMGDTEGARGSLEEVMSEGNAEQKTEAKSLLDQI